MLSVLPAYFSCFSSLLIGLVVSVTSLASVTLHIQAVNFRCFVKAGEMKTCYVSFY